MIDVNNSEGAAVINPWLQGYGITFPVLMQGSSSYDPFGDGYVPYNVFIDPQHIVRYSDSGWSNGTYDEWAELVDIYSVDPTLPLLENLSYTVGGDDNGDGWSDPGETVDLTFSLTNREGFATATTIQGLISCDNPDVTVNGSGTLSFPDCPGGETVGSSSVTVSFAAGMDPSSVEFMLYVSTAEFPQPQYFPFSVTVGHSEVLLVADDNGGGNEVWVTAGLDAMGIGYDVIDAQMTAVTMNHLGFYDRTIWITGTATDPLTEGEQDAITTYLESGGDLLLSSQYVGNQLGGTAFFSDVLHAEHTVDDQPSGFVAGMDEGPVPADEYIWFTGEGANNAVAPSGMEAIAPAEAFMVYRWTTVTAAVLYSMGDARLIYLGFPIESTTGNGSSMDMETFLGYMFDWFDLEGVEPSDPDEPIDLLLTQAMPNPFNPVTNIQISLEQAADVQLSTWDISGRLVFSRSFAAMTAGEHTVQFDGSQLASGTYFTRVTATLLPGGITESRTLKLALIK